VLPPAGTARVERVEGGLTVAVEKGSREDSRRAARVVLPEVAQEAFRVRDEASGLALEVALEGAGPVKAEVVDGYVVYANAHPEGADVVHRFTPEGTEDYLAFERAPAVPEVRYGLRLGEGVAGLRLVGETLEVLDGSGAPRLRMAPPYLVGADGRVTRADVSVEGCAVDTRTEAPWGRRPVAPGSRQCRVLVAWSAEQVQYPAVMDPVWITTGSLAEARRGFTTTLLQDGRVLAVGGDSGTGLTLGSAELYDPVTGTWAATGGLATARQRHAAARLGSGQVLVVGGQDGSWNTTASAERYDPATGTWSSASSLAFARVSHSANLLGDGRVLVAGGYGASYTDLSEAEVYDPATDTWTLTGPMNYPRSGHGAVVLSNGDVMVFGGGDYSTAAFMSEYYDAITGSWSLNGVMGSSRYNPQGVLLADGRVLMAGGGAMAAELYDPAAGGWIATGSLAWYRHEATMSRLSDGRVLMVGGMYSGYGSNSASTEVYDPATGAWSFGPMVLEGRTGHSACVLQDGRVLVVGGMGRYYATVASAEVLRMDLDDVTAPTATLTAPSEGATVEGDVLLSASASDDYGVQRVEFYDGDILIGTATSAPFTLSWYTQWNASNGTHLLTARAYDGSGNSGTSAPVSVTVANDVTPPAVTLTSPAPGTLQGVVTLSAAASDDRGVTMVEFWDGRRLLGTDYEAPYTMTWDVSNVAGGPHTLIAQAYDAVYNMGTSAGVAVTVNQPRTASYNAALGVPWCNTVGALCDSGTYLNGRANLEPELNQPNTLFGSCADGTAGYHADPSLDRIRVYTLDGSSFAPGKTVRIEVTLFAAPYYNSERLDLYSAANANSPVWTYLTTLTPWSGNTTTLTATYVLPSGSLQAVRGRFRYQGTAAPCGTGPYDDHDDLVFAVSGG
jgi:N-acetylneuraminic acid mutarotase